MAFHSHVYNRADHDERYPLGLPWCHEAGVEQHLAHPAVQVAYGRQRHRMTGVAQDSGDLRSVSFGAAPGAESRHVDEYTHHRCSFVVGFHDHAQASPEPGDGPLRLGSTCPPPDKLSKRRPVR